MPAYIFIQSHEQKELTIPMLYAAGSMNDKYFSLLLIERGRIRGPFLLSNS